MIKLSTGEHQISLTASGKDYIDVEVIALTPGVFVNAENGADVVITEEHIQNLHDTYNARVNGERNKIGRKLKRIAHIKDDVLMAPVIDSPLIKGDELTVAPVHQDHIVAQSTMLGRILGYLKLARDNDGLLCLLATLRVMGSDNVSKVNLGALRAVSLGFNLDPDYTISEISFVPYGACPDAGRLPNGAVSLHKTSTKSDVLVKLKDLKEQYINLRNKKEELQITLDVKKISNSLKSRGILLPKDARKLESYLVKFKNTDDRMLVRGMLNLFPTMNTFKTFSRNKEAVNFEELIKMSSDEQKSILNKLAKRFKKETKLSGDYLDKHNESALSGDYLDKHNETALSDEKKDEKEDDQVSMTREQFCNMKKLAEEKDHEGLMTMMNGIGNTSTEINPAHGAQDEVNEGRSRSLLTAIEEVNVKLAKVQEELVSLSSLKGMDATQINFVATTLKEIIEQEKAGK